MNANLSLDFTCQYSPPVGLVSVDFPDSRCPDFGDIIFKEGASGLTDLVDNNSWDARSSETLTVELSTYELLNNVVAYEGQTGTLDNIIITRLFDAYAYDGSTLNQVLLSISPAALLEPRFFAGENSYIDALIKSTFFNPTLRSGEENALELYTRPSIDLGLISPQTGETLQPIVFYKWTMLPHDYVSGEYSVADIEINLPDRLSANGYAGEYASVSIINAPQFSYIQYGGETSSAVFTSYPPVNLSTVEARTGELVENLGLITYRLLDHTQLGGELVQFDFTYIKNEGSPSNDYSGETLSAVLATQDNLPLIAYGGEYADASTSTSYLLELFAYSGQSGTAVLQLRAPIEFSISGYTGEFAYSPYINYTTRFSALAYGGEFGAVSFSTYPSAELLFLAYTGERGVSDIQISQSIGQFSSYSGQSASVSYIDSLENYRLRTGENAFINLNTEVILDVKNIAGDNAGADLTIKPSEGIGRLQPRAGESLSIDTLKVIQHHDLYVVFWHDTHVQIDMGSQTYFDLTVDSCCGGPRALQAQNFRIEMDFAEYPDQVHYGDRVVFQVDLSCRPRFKIEACGGESLGVVDKTDYVAQDYNGNPQMYFRSGEAFALVSFECVNIHRLCKGFFIPSGNNIEIELTDVLDENCYVDRAYTGERFATVLCNNPTFGHNNYFGERLYFELTINQPWLLLAWGGEKLLFDLATTIRQDGVAREGSNMFVKFYEPDWVAGDGQAVFATLEYDVQVEFVDVGCLDNEYIYMNDSGDPIPEKFESVPIELYPYQHDIKARCF